MEGTDKLRTSTLKTNEEKSQAQQHQTMPPKLAKPKSY